MEFTTDHIEHYNFSPSLRSHRKQFLFDAAAPATGTIAGDSTGGWTQSDVSLAAEHIVIAVVKSSFEF